MILPAATDLTKLPLLLRSQILISKEDHGPLGDKKGELGKQKGKEECTDASQLDTFPEPLPARPYSSFWKTKR